MYVLMTGGGRNVDTRCSVVGCDQSKRFRARNLADVPRVTALAEEWRCMRHRDRNLTAAAGLRVHSFVCVESGTGYRTWQLLDGSGDQLPNGGYPYVGDRGYGAVAADFPPGAEIRVTVQVWSRGEEILAAVEQGRTGALLRCLHASGDQHPCFWSHSTVPFPKKELIDHMRLVHDITGLLRWDEDRQWLVRDGSELSGDDSE